jgi:hypothetical protein
MENKAIEDKKGELLVQEIIKNLAFSKIANFALCCQKLTFSQAFS